MARIHLTILLLAVLAAVARASLPSFCKCICGQEYKIIPLGPQHGGDQPQPPPPKSSSSSSTSTITATDTPPTPTSTTPATNRHLSSPNNPFHLLTHREPTNSCQQCTRAFCQSYNLPICKDFDEKDIKTSCFQRDSHKDRLIIWCFLLATGALLGWALAKRLVSAAKRTSSSSSSARRGTAVRTGRQYGGGGRGGGGLLGRGGGAGRNVAAYDPLDDGDNGRGRG
ncbi:hypothetical protein VTJ04DRAFT_6910 [Mycothermus thermophilus]|uniref:uncharacterized protein n=1 Tax=Humicola insolens TaxID=85995 RepID=UPI0037429B8D